VDILRAKRARQLTIMPSASSSPLSQRAALLTKPRRSI